MNWWNLLIPFGWLCLGLAWWIKKWDQIKARREAEEFWLKYRKELVRDDEQR